MPDPFPVFLPHLPPRPHPYTDPNPLTSSWIRRLHLTQPPPPSQTLTLPRRQPPEDTVSTDEPRTLPPPRRRLPPWRDAEETEVDAITGFGPFRWSSAPRGPAAGGLGGGRAQRLSPFFRLPAPAPPGGRESGGGAKLVDLVTPPIGIGNGGIGSAARMFPRISRPIVAGGPPAAAWLTPRAAGAPYHGGVAETAPIRMSHDFHDIQYSVTPQHNARRAPSFNSQHDEPFSYWNMWRFGRNTTTSSVSPIAAVHGNFGRKRNASSHDFLPLKFRKLSGAI